MKRITIRDLARELGVSDRSVSAAVNPHETKVKLKPETMERIRKLADERNYRPDTSARSMRSGRFFNIGYFEASHSKVHYPLLGAESGICDAASEQGYRVTLVRIPSNLSPEQNSLPSVFREAHLDALIVSHLGSLPRGYKDTMDASTFPIVYLNEKQSQNAVYVDDLGAGNAITEHLISLGYTRILFLSGDKGHHYSTHDRPAGYTQAMLAAGLTPVIEPHNGLDKDQLLQMRKESGQAPALVCVDDAMALRVFGVLYGMGLRVPDDVALAGFGADRDFPIQLTTMRVPFYEMAYEAVMMSTRLISPEAGTHVPAVEMKAELIPGATAVEQAPGKREKE